MLSVRDIEKLKPTGFVTSVELDDIVKEKYPEEFGNRHLIPIFNKFC